MKTIALTSIDSRSARVLILSASALVLLGICLLDSWLNPEVTLDILYILPVSAVALLGERTLAIAFSVAGALGWFVAQTVSGYRADHPNIRVWDAIMLLGILITVSLLIVTLRRLRDEVAGQHRTLQILNQLKDESLSTYSHDIRSLLTSVIASCYVLLSQHRGPVNEEQREILNRAMRSSRSIIELVNTLLDLTRIESGQETVKLEALDLVDVLRDCLTNQQSVADQRRIRLLLSAAAPQIRMDADRTKLMRVINNLVSNAIKFSPADSDVVVDAVSDASYATFAVTDRGPGIAAEDQPILFDRFARLSKPAKAYGQGTGLGLSITRALVRLHGGDISVASELGKGATFSVRLPLHAGILVGQPVPAGQMGQG